MSRPAINSIKLNAHLTLSECRPDSACRTNNWWLYDDRAYGRGMNIAMRAKTRDEAFVEAIEFWAERATSAQREYAEIKAKVDTFVAQFAEAEDEND